jgi:hypothetical protein
VFVIQIHGTKVSIYGANINETSAQALEGEEFPQKLEISRYPSEGFDLTNEKQREAAYKALYGVLRYCISSISRKESSHPQIEVPDLAGV